MNPVITTIQHNSETAMLAALNIPLATVLERARQRDKRAAIFPAHR